MNEVSRVSASPGMDQCKLGPGSLLYLLWYRYRLYVLACELGSYSDVRLEGNCGFAQQTAVDPDTPIEVLVQQQMSNTAPLLMRLADPVFAWLLSRCNMQDPRFLAQQSAGECGKLADRDHGRFPVGPHCLLHSRPAYVTHATVL
jgi:hypothetical protein